MKKSKKEVGVEPIFPPPAGHVSEGIFIRQKTIRRKYLYADILWVGASGSYCDIKLASGETLTVIHSLTDIEYKFPVTVFVRIHRSYLVNIHRVDAIVGNMLRIGKDKLPVSVPYRKQVAYYFDVLETTTALFKYPKKKSAKLSP